MMPAEIVGRLEIPAAVLEHRFVIEALACAHVMADSEDENRRVVGTAEGRLCELYGWGANIKAHRDNTGWTYLMCLNEGISYIHARLKARATGVGPSAVVRVTAGDVIRLNDFHEHWTEDAAPRVAAFVGSWPQPWDEGAVSLLQTGIDKLVAGDYYGAPRVARGYRALQPDECLVADADMTGYEPMLKADADQQGRFIITCHCEKPAVRVDDHWPYHWEHNRCQQHLIGSAS